MREPDPPSRPSQPVRFHKGRGTGSNAPSRFEVWRREADQDHRAPGADDDEEEIGAARPATTVTGQSARSIIARNDSPDIPFDQSINPYQGCEHGCVYCYARPTHAYLGLSPGLDFETRIFAKTNAAELLRAELRRPGYAPALIALGSNTDPYQPAERRLGITRSVLELLSECRLPVSITTKSALVTRDIDLLAGMAERGLVRVHISVGTLDRELARRMEPRAPTPARRIEAMRELAAAGIPVGVFASPLIPAINDVDLERVLEAAAAAGASDASFVILRLPLEVRDLFVEWLEHHYPLRAAHVMSLVRQMRQGRDYDPDFEQRMRGSGIHARLIEQRFRIAAARCGLAAEHVPMDVSAFRPPPADPAQASLF
ncbi:MAG: PA0069 family radical SAM protein [Burkholderiales bacterium]|nr:PA0069 family radical SAM protein [Burkholderiales bacterium]